MHNLGESKRVGAIEIKLHKCKKLNVYIDIYKI